MRIHLLTPASTGSVGGNRTTTERWASFLTQLGADVHVDTSYPKGPVDLLIALHAWRNASHIQRFRQENPTLPIVVVLTGTDIYKYLGQEPEVTARSLEAATVLIGLHHRVQEVVPTEFHDKLRVILQSAPIPVSDGEPNREHLDVCVIAHLREEKDPLRTAYAARDLPATSAIHVRHYGRAYTPEWAEVASQETLQNPRYEWIGETDQDGVAKVLATSHLLVVSSAMEGGANVISEAIQADLPILASDIPGNAGLLGEHYPGYFPVKSTLGLRDRLMQFEGDPDFRKELREHCRKLRPAFQPEVESEALRALIDELMA